jgi:hypothetical protein
MGGGANSTPPSDQPPGGGIYQTDTQNVLQNIGKSIQQAGATYGKTVAQGDSAAMSQGMANYKSGSGSPWLGAGQTASTDQPNTAAPPIPNQSSDQQKMFYQLYQAFQQRLQNEGGGQFQF